MRTLSGITVFCKTDFFYVMINVDELRHIIMVIRSVSVFKSCESSVRLTSGLGNMHHSSCCSN